MPAMEGYAKLAAMMGRHPEMAIFRAFRPLNTQNLLYLQAELVELERDLEFIASLDNASGNPPKQAYARSWSALQKSKEDGDGLQLSKVLTIRAKLKEYNEALLQQSLCFGLDRPSGCDMNFLRKWLTGSKMGGCFLSGREQQVWDQAYEADLISLRKSHPEKDVLSRWLTGTFVGCFHRSLGHHFKRPIPHDVESGIANYDNTLLAVADLVGTVISSLLPISSIMVLYFVKNMLMRLTVVAGFTALFSITLAIVTKARRIEVFAATAAFASVQVVFVGTANNG
ncbi:MAG: hypothetical protein M1830_003967 [Pleopsidium flavum]|nr:MAG: hypothetical protein M1830_003967 [Pleopsidium flavum]